ncbi:MAG: 50S ribosomal protein L30e [Methanobacteriota archaeon]|nr:MAG: 50S ribosomal protein L30e [Euryarchaeota archaeon]
MIDVARALKTASTTGEIRFGLEQTRKSLRSGEAKMVIVSSNCPAKNEFNSMGAARTYVFPGTNVELGAACGKPFAISALAIVKPGDSNILSLQ